MEYLVGLLLALGVAAFAIVVGFHRDRAFYPTVAIVVASYYILFAVMGASGRTLAMELLAACVFIVLAVAGYKETQWLVVAALVGHGLFDSIHHLIIANPGVPAWWPGFCLAFDAAFGAALAMHLLRSPRSA